MTTVDTASTLLSDAHHPAQLRRAVIASTVGTTIEWYDFLLYSIVTGLAFGKLFFPESDPLVGVLQAFAIYTVGFIARPIGAAFFRSFRRPRRAQRDADRYATDDRIGDLRGGLCTDLRLDRHLGRRHPDDHPFYPGDRGRRRMGRLGAVVDGMGAHQPPSRLYHLLAAVRRAGRAAIGKSSGVRIQRDFRRPVPGLGLAHPVHAEHRHGCGRALKPATP